MIINHYLIITLAVYITRSCKYINCNNMVGRVLQLHVDIMKSFVCQLVNCHIAAVQMFRFP